MLLLLLVLDGKVPASLTAADAQRSNHLYLLRHGQQLLLFGRN
jgi:hypothetical protein